MNVEPKPIEWKKLRKAIQKLATKFFESLPCYHASGKGVADETAMPFRGASEIRVRVKEAVMIDDLVPTFWLERGGICP